MARVWDAFWALLAGHNPLSAFLYIFLFTSALNAIVMIFFKGKKIQPKGFKWTTYRNEALFALFNIAASAILIGGLTSFLTSRGYIQINQAPTHWWVVVGEYLIYFVAFDTWFYWLHRLMHKEPIYKYVHKIHHRSTAPNFLTTLSVGPLESLVNGGFLPVFTALLTVHSSSLALMNLTTFVMGLYVHSGHEFLPTWWNRSWATKWFITATFHDQHHKYFRWNFGGYTTVWDHLCGTKRAKYDSDFESRTALRTQRQPAESVRAAA